MARGEQLGRQWKIIQTLITSRQGRSAADLASELECHPRTVYRDLEALQIAGFPIYTERVDGKNLWSVLDTVKHQIPVPFTLTELMALYFSTDMLKVFRETAFYDSLESLSQKIKATLPPDSLRYVKGLEQTIEVGIKPYCEYSRFREILNRVHDAALRRRSIEMVYFTMSRRKESRRKVDPYRIWFFNGTFYLIAYCHTRCAVRIFAVNRIKMLHLTNEPFTVQEGFRFDAFTQSSFGVFQGEMVRIKVWFSREVGGYIREKIWHPSQSILIQRDGSVLFEAEVPWSVEIRAWIMGWGADALVLEPQSVREEIQAEARLIAERYDGSAQAPSHLEPEQESLS
ncbi:helix-turn-helix transcriptional regulator [Desulfatiglans anilini]|uniref:helix-turn-helix transcriptional regulator n=1 Tax=Desulfatiglans anilini TaxID=90728 RepID=UPI00040D4DC2|nr:transcriptional regulator [Desulfatiglans anilini]